jgi:hypothetical protein
MVELKKLRVASVKKEFFMNSERSISGSTELPSRAG